jgi:transcriptional regulator with XRE-family HTH domain
MAAVRLAISKRTLQDWEQGRHTPSGAVAAYLNAVTSGKLDFRGSHADTKERKFEDVVKSAEQSAALVLVY